MAALALAMLTIGLDATVLNVALPTLATDLNASNSQLQWFNASYTLVLGALIIPMGGLGDRFGRKRVLLSGLALFGVSSAIGAFAHSAGLLIGARALQGVGGAAMLSLALAMLPVLFDDSDERSRAMNIWVTCSAVGLPLGPIVGGWLLNHFWWGSVFLINIPLVVIGLAALMVYLPETRSEQAQPTDGAGIVLSSTGLVGVIFGLIQAGQNGWTSPSVIAPLLGGLALLAGFVVWERRAAHPVVDLALFANRDFTVGTALSTVANFALFGLLFVMPQYFQDVNGADPLGTGVRLLPMIGGMVVATRVGPVLLKRLGSRIVIIAGLVLCTAALALGATTGVNTGYPLAAVWITLLGAGIGLTMPASMTTAMSALSRDRAGSGSGLLQALRQVGGTIGVAVLGTVLSSGYHTRLDDSDVPASAHDAVRSSLSAGVHTADRLNNTALAHTVRSAFVHGMDIVLLASASLTALGAILAFAMLARRGTKTPAATPSAPATDQAGASPQSPVLAGAAAQFAATEAPLAS